MKLKSPELLTRCAGRCQKLIQSPHRRHLAAHGLELVGSALAIIQEGIVAHLLLFSGVGLLIIFTILEETK